MASSSPKAGLAAARSTARAARAAGMERLAAGAVTREARGRRSRPAQARKRQGKGESTDGIFVACRRGARRDERARQGDAPTGTARTAGVRLVARDRHPADLALQIFS